MPLDWREAQPRAVVMENVPDMALDREMFILRAMVEELEALGRDGGRARQIGRASCRERV